MDLNKSCGDDFLYPQSLRNEHVKEAVIHSILNVLNSGRTSLPEFWKKTRLVLLSKSDSEYALVSETRPIAVQQTITRVFEKTLLQKLKALGMLQTGRYQTGFKEGMSTHLHATTLLKSITDHQRRDTKNRKIYVFVDLKKAYDSVRRHQLFGIMAEAYQNNPQQLRVVEALFELHKNGRLVFD